MSTPITMRSILAEVCAERGVTEADVLSQSRKRKVSRPRQDFMWRCRQVKRADGRGRYSLPQIGAFLQRDHTSVLFGVRAHEARLGEPVHPQGQTSRVDDCERLIPPDGDNSIIPVGASRIAPTEDLQECS